MSRHQHQELEERLEELRQEEKLIEQQLAIQAYAGSYEIALQFPAIVLNGSGGDKAGTRTDHDLVQHRLLEAGLLYDVPLPTADAVAAASSFIHNLESTDCFHSVRVEIGSTSTESTDNDGSTTEGGIALRRLRVHLHEKNWYRLHAGAGLKTDGSWFASSSSGSGGATDSFLPVAEVDVSIGLRNISGCFDRTDVQYTLDTHNIGAWNLTHIRPLYTVLPQTLSDLLLEQSTGSQYSLSTRAALDTMDHTGTSSYHLFQRLLSIKAATMPDELRHNAATKRQQPWYSSIEWGVYYRDLIPRRHTTLPYHFAASPEIVAQAGPSVKNSWSAVVQYDSTHRTGNDTTTSGRESSPSMEHSQLPLSGVQFQSSAEVATPPGDVGFVKCQAAGATHVSLTDRLAFHGSISTGYLHALDFGGLCPTPSIVSDRFMLGGTGSFRGFVPAGIGPRAGASRQQVGADALGGNFFYSATAMASISPASLSVLSSVTRHIRLFGFATAGTCVDINWASSPLSSPTPSIGAILGSTRASAGFGIATQALGPARVEATYSWPLRYGPNDGRRRFQFGMSFSL